MPPQKELLRPVAVGSLVTVALFLVPQLYAYAPILGGVIAGVLCGNLRDGAKAGVVLGVVMIPVGTVLTIVAIFLPTGMETGVSVLFRSMRGMGPMNGVFYITVVYFIVAYSIVAGGLFGTFGAGISTVIYD